MNSERRVLIITYYWPPSGGSGVQRWLKFVKYLTRLGWKPVIYTPSNPEYPSIDESLLSNVPEEVEVIKTPIWEPYSAYKKFVGQSKEQGINAGFISEDDKPKFTEKLSRWIRGNFFIPDARKFWVKPSKKFLSEYLAANPVELIISTGPPHSMHLIANEIKSKHHLPWIADFRDPWTQIDFYDELMLTGWADKKHHRLEKKVLENADHVLVIGEVMKSEMSKLAKITAITAIPNGFDQADYTLDSPPDLDEKFSIAHIGSFTASRNPSTLWKVLSDMAKENDQFGQDLVIRAIGKTDVSIIKELQSLGIEQHLEKVDYLAHDLVISEQQKSRVLLLVVNRTSNQRMIVTGKIFEYLNSGRPILAIGPEDGELAKILTTCSSPAICGYDDYAAIRQMVTTQYEAYLNNKAHLPPTGLDQYARKELSSKLSAIMEQVVG